MKQYIIIKKHFDKIDTSFLNNGDVLICLDPQQVDLKESPEHLHDKHIGFRYGICVLKITDFLPEILDIITSDWEEARLEVEKLGFFEKKMILVACEESQAVTIEFRKLGFEAYSCDLQESSGGHPEWHIIGDAVAEAYSGKYFAMIGHPPCTFISNAGACRMYPTAGNLNKERFAKALEAKELFLKLLNAPINHIALENPTPLKIVDLPKFTQVIQPYQFGHEYSKRTLLWLKNLPHLLPTDIKQNYKPYLPSNTGGKKRGQKYMFKKISQKDSSKTFTGIAKAMAEQWGNYLLNTK